MTQWMPPLDRNFTVDPYALDAYGMPWFVHMYPVPMEQFFKQPKRFKSAPRGRKRVARSLSPKKCAPPTLKSEIGPKERGAEERAMSRYGFGLVEARQMVMALTVCIVKRLEMIGSHSLRNWMRFRVMHRVTETMATLRVEVIRRWLLAVAGHSVMSAMVCTTDSDAATCALQVCPSRPLLLSLILLRRRVGAGTMSGTQWSATFRKAAANRSSNKRLSGVAKFATIVTGTTEVLLLLCCLFEFWISSLFSGRRNVCR